MLLYECYLSTIAPPLVFAPAYASKTDISSINDAVYVSSFPPVCIYSPKEPLDLSPWNDRLLVYLPIEYFLKF